MASIKIKISTPKSLNLRHWMWVVVCGALLTAISLLSRGGLAPVLDTAGCQVVVNVDALNERTGPSLSSPVDGAPLARGALVSATKTVTAGYRQLGDGKWVSDQSVAPTAGSVCS
jgi:hypothetical protein